MMGREIRKVPPGWQHPKDERGRFIPMHDQTWLEAMDIWVNETERVINDYRTWRQVYQEQGSEMESFYAYENPEPENYRPDWGDVATCFQIYETVSEGTPVSPIFESKGDLRDWLISEGTSPEAAQMFADTGFSFSGAFIPGRGYVANYEAMVLM